MPLGLLANPAAPAKSIGQLKRIVRARINQAPKDAEALHDLGIVLALQRKFDDAARILRKASTIAPGDWRNQSALGRVLVLARRQGEAIPCLIRAAKQRPESFRAWLRLSRTLLAEVRPAMTAFAVGKLCEIAGNSPVPRFYRGLLQFRNRDYDAAAATFRQCIEAKFERERARGLLGLCLIHKGESDHGLSLIRESIANGVSDSEVLLRAAVYMSRVPVIADNAGELLRRAAQRDRTGWAHFLLGRLAHAAGNDAAAMEHMSAAAGLMEDASARLHPPPAGILQPQYEIAAFLSSHGGDEIALPLVEAALGRNAGDPEIGVLYGTILCRMGRHAEASEALSRYAPQARRFTEGYGYWVESLSELGDFDSAERVARHYVLLAPASAEANLLLGGTRLRLGDTVGAEAPLIVAKRSNPNGRGLAEAVAECEAVLGRPLAMAAQPVASDYAIKEIPPKFQPRWEQITSPPDAGILDSLLVHLRVMAGLMEREVKTRFNDDPFGYLWAFIQPLSFIVTLFVIFRFIGRVMPAGISTLGFLTTGLIPVVVLFMNTNRQCQSAVRQNVQLLYYRQVTPYALITARAALEYATGMTVLIIVVTATTFIDNTLEISDLLLIIRATIMIWLLGAILGSIIYFSSLFIKPIARIGLVLNRALFFLSGSFYYAGELPYHVREVLLLNPVFHCVELMRDGFFKGYTANFASETYVLEWILGGMLFALLLERASRRRQAV